MNGVLEKYRSKIVPVNYADSIVDELLGHLVKSSDMQWCVNDKVGMFCLFRHKSYPDYVLEYVKGSNGDSISTLYHKNSIFNDISEFERVRYELMKEIAVGLCSLPSYVTFWDEGRGKQVAMREMGTAQLMDVLFRKG